MPSFDIVSEVDHHELQNAVDQANKEVLSRFDFKGTNSSFSHKDGVINLATETDFQLDQMYDILLAKLTKRNIDVGCLERGKADCQLKSAKQSITVKQGIDSGFAKKLVKLIKDSKLKVQASIQGDTVRVSGKKRDDLQSAMALLRGQESLDMPVQFNNFRD